MRGNEEFNFGVGKLKIDAEVVGMQVQSSVRKRNSLWSVQFWGCPTRRLGRSQFVYQYKFTGVSS